MITGALRELYFISAKLYPSCLAGFLINVANTRCVLQCRGSQLILRSPNDNLISKQDCCFKPKRPAQIRICTSRFLRQKAFVKHTASCICNLKFGLWICQKQGYRKGTWASHKTKIDFTRFLRWRKLLQPTRKAKDFFKNKSYLSRSLKTALSITLGWLKFFSKQLLFCDTVACLCDSSNLDNFYTVCWTWESINYVDVLTERNIRLAHKSNSAFESEI